MASLSASLNVDSHSRNPGQTPATHGIELSSQGLGPLAGLRLWQVIYNTQEDKEVGENDDRADTSIVGCSSATRL